jgi:hypothetical protein
VGIRAPGARRARPQGARAGNEGIARERGARALEGYPMLTAREGDHLGRAPRGQPQHLRRSRFHRGQQAHTQAGRDADRLLGALRGQGPAGPSHGPEQANSPRTNGFVERFKCTVLEEFFRPTMRSRLHESVEAHDEKGF